MEHSRIKAPCKKIEKTFPPWFPLSQPANSFLKCSSPTIFSCLNWFSSFLSLSIFVLFQLSPVLSCLNGWPLTSSHPPSHFPSTPKSLQCFREPFLEMGGNILIGLILSRTCIFVKTWRSPSSNDTLAKPDQSPVQIGVAPQQPATSWCQLWHPGVEAGTFRTAFSPSCATGFSQFLVSSLGDRSLPWLTGVCWAALGTTALVPAAAFHCEN